MRILLTIPKAFAVRITAAEFTGCAAVNPKLDDQCSATFIEPATG
jgi:hypothetical protein